MDFSTLEAVIGYGAGCVSGYGFAIRVLMPNMIAAKVAPLEIKLQEVEEKLSNVNKKLDKEMKFSKSLQKKILGIKDE